MYLGITIVSIVSIVSVIWKLRRKNASAFHVAPDQEQLEINDFQLGQSGYRDAGSENGDLR